MTSTQPEPALLADISLRDGNESCSELRRRAGRSKVFPHAVWPRGIQWKEVFVLDYRESQNPAQRPGFLQPQPAVAAIESGPQHCGLRFEAVQQKVEPLRGRKVPRVGNVRCGVDPWGCWL